MSLETSMTPPDKSPRERGPKHPEPPEWDETPPELIPQSLEELMAASLFEYMEASEDDSAAKAESEHSGDRAAEDNPRPKPIPAGLQRAFNDL